MHFIRRAALRSLRSQPSTVSSSTRASFVERSFNTQHSRQTILSQTRCYSDAAEKARASPAEEEGGQTVTREPSAEEQKDIREESVSASDSATSEAFNSASDAVSAVKDRASEVVGAVSSAVNSAIGDAAPRRSSGSFERGERNWRGGDRGGDRGVRSRDRFDRGDRPDRFQRGDRGEREQRNAEPSKILYVGNLYFDLTPERMQREFEQFGDVTNCKIVTDASGMSKGFGYIEFDNLESAAKAIEALNGQNLEGRRMAVQYHVRRMKTPSTQTRNPPSRTLFVGNMSFQMSDKDLHDLFRNVKNVLDVRVAIDRRSGQPRGFAHADFTDIESAQEAKKFLESKVVYGRQLRIDYGLPSALSKPRESRDSGESQ